MSGRIQKPARKTGKAARGTAKVRVRRVRNPKYALLGMNEEWRELLGKTRSVICNEVAEIHDVMQKATKELLWISPAAEMTDRLLRASHDVSMRSIGNLLMLKSPRPRTLALLHSRFETVVGESPSFVMLPSDQLAEVLSMPVEQSQDLIIGGTVDQTSGLLALVRGNLETLIVPLSIFHPSGVSRPNFGRLSIGEYGHSVVFGDYEASVDFILHTADPVFRTRTNAKRHADDRGFGPSLRRLRIQRRLSRGDFPGVSSKTIARLERGEVDRPRGSTLRAICDVLGIAPDEIEAY